MPELIMAICTHEHVYKNDLWVREVTNMPTVMNRGIFGPPEPFPTCVW